MTKKMSKFDWEIFNDTWVDRVAVSKQRYTLEDAFEIAERELDMREGGVIVRSDAFVVHRAGVDPFGEPCIGWWLEGEERERSCAVWVFRLFDEVVE